MHRFRDIGLNRQQRSKLDLSDLENNLYNQSTPLKFENSTRITSEKLYEAIHFGSTSLLLINIEKYVKMSQTWPFWPWQWPLEWFNQILLFTVHCHHPGEASCQNKEKITKPILNKWTINVKLEKSAKFRPLRPWKITFRAIQSNPALGSWLVPSLGRFMPK